MEDLQVQAELRDGAWVITLRGEARVEFSRRLVAKVEEVLAQEPAHLLLNCQGLKFLDSASTGALLQTVDLARAHDRRMAMYGLTSVVRRVLDVTGLEDVFGSAPNETQARALLTER